ncbi:hypothetical protein HY463_00060 [Candidatus Peregrinibacteria bacterium]|nr:hypothetical protein [Candidatus Peregrinibacteria bacterium]
MFKKVCRRYISMFTALMLAVSIVVPTAFLHNIPLTKAATYTVSTTADNGAGSLRQAIIDANANAGADTIAFTASGTIVLSTSMDAITGSVTIDGTGAPDYQPGADILIQGTSSIDCLVYGNGGGGSIDSVLFSGCRKGVQVLDGASSVTLGLAGSVGLQINGGTTGISIEGGTTIKVYNNAIGNSAANAQGISITGGTTIDIGGGDAGQGNIIVNNTAEGISIGASTGVTVAGNFIGVDTTTGNPQGNAASGIQVNSATATNVLIGGAETTHRNYISANGTGVNIISNGNGVSVKNNYIGVSSTGFDVGNTGDGIAVLSGGNTIGATGDGNVVSGNGFAGVHITTSSSDAGNTITANYIGLDGTGNTAVPNSATGVFIENSGGTTVSNNYISGNAGAGMDISSTATGSTYIYGNTIGLGVDGTTAVGNALQGIIASATIVVGDTSDDTKKNTIASNVGSGIKINNGNALSSVIVNNYIGTTSAGLERGNAIGVELTNGATLATIGSETGSVQEIDYNTNVGILVDGNTTNFNKISKNNFLGNYVAPISNTNAANSALSTAVFGVITADTSGSSGTSVVVSAGSEMFMLSGTGSNATWVGTGVVAADSTWDMGVAITNANNYWLYIVDTSNNTSATSATGVIVADNTASSAPVLTSATGTVTAASYTLTGTKDKYTSVRNADSEIVAIDNTTSWTSSTSLVEGDNVLTISSYDYSSNVSSTGTYTITLDTIAPVTPVISYNPYSAANTQTVTGTTEASALVYVNDVYTTTADSSGAFTLVLSTSASLSTYNINALDASAHASPYTTVSIGKTSGGSSGPETSSSSSTTTNNQGESMAGESEPDTEPEATTETTETSETETTPPPASTSTPEPEPAVVVAPVTVTEPAPVTTPTPTYTYVNLYPEETQTSVEETTTEPVATPEAPTGAPVINESLLSASFLEASNTSDGIPEWWKLENFGAEDINLTEDVDSDGDGIMDSQEFLYGTNPKSDDSDYDGVSDSAEINLGGNPASYDTDGDGIPDDMEQAGQVAVYNPQALSVQVIEKYIEENDIQLDAASNQTLGEIDSDGDGISDEQELSLGSDPTSGDTDSDGLSDGQEVILYDSNPVKASKVAPVSIGNVKKGQVNASGTQYLIGATNTPNADIEIVIIDASGKETVIGTTQTDANGFYSTLTSAVDAGTYTVAAVMKKGEKTVNISYPAELKVADDVLVAPPHIDVEVTKDSAVIKGLAISENTSVVVVWRSLVLTSTIVADQNFTLKAPKGLEAGEHSATVYSVNNKDNSHSTPVQVEFTISTTGFATGQTKGISPLITIGGSALILLSLTALAIYKRRKNNGDGQHQ